MPNFLEKCSKWIAEKTLLRKGDRVLVAVSGGPDSVVAAYILKELAYEIGIVHCNFKLREEADEEAAFVRTLAERFEIPFFFREFDTQAYAENSHVSIQVAARDLRYAYFAELMEKENYDKCATAHHRDDQVETMLMSLIKGKHPHFMKQIPVIRGHYIRPLLPFTKLEILEFAAENDIEFRIDKSNKDNKYTRNYVRNKVIPVLKGLNPSFDRRLMQVAEDLKLHFALFEKLFDPLLPKVVKKEGRKLKIMFQPFSEQFNMDFMPLFLKWFLYRQGFSGAEILEACKLHNSMPGKQFECTKATFLRDRESILIRFSADRRYGNADPLELKEIPFTGHSVVYQGRVIVFERQQMDGQFSFPEEEDVHCLDLDRVVFPLVIRRWEKGDKMKSLGMKGRKKLSDIFIDEQYDLFLKAEALIFQDQKQILLLSGFRIAESVKLRVETKEILVIRILKAGDTV